MDGGAWVGNSPSDCKESDTTEPLHFTSVPNASHSKESACNTGDQGSIPGSGRFPWRREWLPSPVFLPGEFHGQRNLSSCSPWSCKELDTIKQLTLSLFSFSSALEIQVHELTLKVMNIENCENYLCNAHSFLLALISIEIEG